jgi:ABC-type branched-subunit amino acid transport system substrate-binding protein
MTITRIFRRFALLAALAVPLHATAQGVTQNEILLGQSTALTGPLAALGQDTSAGSKAYFDYINAQGGVHGRKIRLITLDDGYNPQKAVANAKQLIEKEQVLALFGMIGTPANIAIMPLIGQAGIPNIAPASGSDMVRVPFNRLVFHTTPSYADEIEKIVDHALVRGIRKIGVVYQNNAFGKEGLANLKRSLAERGLELAGAVSIESSGADADQASAALAQTGPQAILLITAGKSSVDFIKASNKRAVGMQYFALSVMASQAAIHALGPDGAGVVVSQSSPFPFSATSGIVQEYQRVMKKMGIKNWSFASIGGFVSAKILVEGLRRAGRNLTRESLMDALETMQKLDYDGVVVNYSKTSHLGPRYVELTVISRDGRFLR